MNTTTTIQLVFLFIFKFCIPSGVKITIALINMIQAKPEGFWYLQSNGVIMQMPYYKKQSISQIIPLHVHLIKIKLKL